MRLSNPGKHLYPPPLSPVTSDQFREQLEQLPAGTRRAQLYVHLPFCQTICTFCPIHKYRLTAASPVAEYIEAMVLELRALGRLPVIRQMRFDNIYFGGGTPSVVPDDALARLLDCMHDSFTFAMPQITFEGHVQSLTRDKIRFLRRQGFNRISTGVQTFDPELRRQLNLTPTEDDIRRCVQTAYEEGFQDLNIDLMYNLPGQSKVVWERDLTRAAALNPAGMDIYETVVAHTTPLHRQVRTQRLEAEDDGRRAAECYELAEEILGAYGYDHKNLYVWDRPGFENRLVGLQGELRDNGLQIVGAGLSAYSLIHGMSFMNETGLHAYVERVRGTGHGVKSCHRCSERERMERYMIMSLEEFRLDRDRFAASFGVSMDDEFAVQLQSFLRRGLIEWDPTGYRLTALGRAWATTMSIEFFGPPSTAEILRARIANTFFGGMTHEEAFDMPLFALFHPQALLRDRQDLRLLVDYARHLRRSNPRWLRELLRRFARTVARSGLPDWRWFLSALLRRGFRPGTPMPT